MNYNFSASIATILFLTLIAFIIYLVFNKMVTGWGYERQYYQDIYQNNIKGVLFYQILFGILVNGKIHENNKNLPAAFNTGPEYWSNTVADDATTEEKEENEQFNSGYTAWKQKHPIRSISETQHKWRYAMSELEMVLNQGLFILLTLNIIG